MENFNHSDQVNKPVASGILMDKFNALSPNSKRKLTTCGIMLGLFCLLIIGYYATRDHKVEGKKDTPIEEVRMDQNVLEKSLYAKTEELLVTQKRETEELKKAIKSIQYTLSQNSQIVPAQVPEKEVTKPEPKRNIAIPKPPPMDQNDAGEQVPKVLFNTMPPPIPSNGTPQYVGGIEMVQAVIDDKKPKALEDSKKKQIYLPPSFMEATLLSGVAAPTTNVAKSNPLPLLFRVKDLAVLPNKVKADLKGCFIIGSAVGNLADERVHIRLNTLSCVAKNGDAVIDQTVKGFVVDEDGKVGLKGRVVAKMGIHIARTALAGFIGGMGDALSSSMQTNSLNALGQTQSQLTDTDAGSIAKAGLGEGISSATKDLQKFYLQLAEQTLPVIEIGSTKDVTVVISEGVGLEIMEKGKENETK
jgi:conjugal transfer pilus assembly protein TraB